MGIERVNGVRMWATPHSPEFHPCSGDAQVRTGVSRYDQTRESEWLDLNQRSPASKAGRMTKLPHTQICGGIPVSRCYHHVNPVPIRHVCQSTPFGGGESKVCCHSSRRHAKGRMVALVLSLATSGCGMDSNLRIACGDSPFQAEPI